jgi:hypothetical protein
LRKLNIQLCSDLPSLGPLGSLSRLMDLNLRGCNALPPSALAPLSSCTALR